MSLPIAWVTEYDLTHVLVIAPCCGKIMRHGSCHGENFEGSRVAHCECGKGEYFVKKYEGTKKVDEVNYK